MKAWLLDGFHGLSALRLAEVPDPVPSVGEVLLDVHYAALNPADRFLAEARYPARPRLPHILGRDGLGTVAATGPGVTDIQPGRRMVILRSDIGVTRWGTFAEKVSVPAEALAPAPSDWSEPEASSAALVYLTAWQALTQWGPLPLSVVLITGASGGVGIACLQLAKAQGHTVIALSRDPQKRGRLHELGADITADPQAADWRARVMDSLDGRRVDLAIDTIGGPFLREVIHTLGDHGKVSVIGSLAGPVPEFNTSTLLFRRIRLGGVAVGTYTPAESRTGWNEILAQLARRGYRPQIDSLYPLDQLPQAFEKLRQGPFGKVLLSTSTSTGK